jgi:cytochrome c peroxidase
MLTTLLTGLRSLARLLPLLALATACSLNDVPLPATETAAPPTPYVLVTPDYFPNPEPVPANNPLTVEGVALGRRLFYETALSIDNTVACGSCHVQSKAFTDGRARALGVGGQQHPRSAMALANLLWEPTLAWDGSSTALETQARTPLENPIEMHQLLPASVARLQALPKYPPLFRKAFGSSVITSENLLKALAQFERTLVSSNSRFDQFKRGDPTALTSFEKQGLLLFSTHPVAGSRGVRGGNCSDCHAGNLQAGRDFANNGLDLTFTDLGRAAVTGFAADRGRFQVPSLRNIELTGPYMHDGRLANLDSVLNHYNEHIVFNSPNLDPIITNASNLGSPQPGLPPLGLGLTATEKAQIVAFLKTLTDTTFTHDARFGPPRD